MQPTLFRSFACLSLLSVGSATTVSYDTIFDDASGSLNTIACSDGSHGLITRGYKTFGSLPSYPFIGGTSDIDGWNSPNCGSCYQLVYIDPNDETKKKSINILAIDVAKEGFNVAKAALDELTGGNAEQFGNVDVEAKLVDRAVCGL